MKYRDTNRGCMVCGGQTPRNVEKETRNGYHRYVCPDCGATICQGVVSRDGEPASARISLPPAAQNIVIPDDIAWRCWETWWTERLYVSAMNGRVIDGNRELLDFVEKLEDIHDRRS